MISQALSHYQHTLLTCVGLLLFLGVFIGSLLWTFRKNGRDFYHFMENLPLEENQNATTQNSYTEQQSIGRIS
jgi:cbb3-type cytochrome oxidase subunit 3